MCHVHEHFLETVIRTLTGILKKIKRFRPEPLVFLMEKVRPRGPDEVSGEPSHRPPPPPWGYLEGCRQESRSCLALGIVPGPCRVGRSGARSQSCPSARREAPLQSLQGGDLQPPGAGRLQRKSGAALPKDAACSTRGGLASGWARLLGGPGSPRLIIQPLQGAAVGAGEGQGSEGAVEIRNTPSPRNTHTELVLGPRPWGGLITALCCPRAWAAQDLPSSPPGV